MKRFTVGLTVIILSFAFLGSSSFLEARDGSGGRPGWGGHHGGYYKGHVGWGGHHRGYYGGHHGGLHIGIGLGFWPGYYWGNYPYYWGAPVVGWPYYPPQATEAAPGNSQPEQQQPYYWYYCENPQGYYPYIKSCPGGWIQVIPNMAPPNQ